MIWLGLAVYQTDINCRAYKNCRQSQIFFKKNVAKLLTTKESKEEVKKQVERKCGIHYTKSIEIIMKKWRIQNGSRKAVK